MHDRDSELIDTLREEANTAICEDTPGYLADILLEAADRLEAWALSIATHEELTDDQLIAGLREMHGDLRQGAYYTHAEDPGWDVTEAAARRLESLTTQSEEDPETVRRRMVDQHYHCVVTGHSLNYSNAVLITAINASPAIVHADGEAFTLELLRQLEVAGVQVHRPVSRPTQ